MRNPFCILHYSSCYNALLIGQDLPRPDTSLRKEMDKEPEEEAENQRGVLLCLILCCAFTLFLAVDGNSCAVIFCHFLSAFVIF